MILKNRDGRLVAELRFSPGLEVHSSAPVNPALNPSIMRILRAIPREFLQVDVRYFGIGYEAYVPLTKRSIDMDIGSALSDYEQENSTPTEVSETPKKVFFVAPTSETSPDDGVLTYSTIETIFDLSSIPERSVLTFRPDQSALLKCLCDNSALFGLELRSLTGLPQTDYSVEFEAATWSLDKVAYLPFLSELRLSAEIEAQTSASKETQYDKEKAVYTRKTGKIKEHANFELAVPEGEGAVGDDAELT